MRTIDPQASGQRALLAIVDTATATRYGLPTAQLLNAAGRFVVPTTESLLAGEQSMTPSPVTGVLAPNPSSAKPGGLPPHRAELRRERTIHHGPTVAYDYAQFMRYAAGPSQQPGQLPAGMAPLPDALKAQTIAAAATFQTPPTSIPAPTPTPTVTPR